MNSAPPFNFAMPYGPRAGMAEFKLSVEAELRQALVGKEEWKKEKDAQERAWDEKIEGFRKMLAQIDSFMRQAGISIEDRALPMPPVIPVLGASPEKQEPEYVRRRPTRPRNSLAAEIEQLVRRFCLENSNQGFMPNDIKKIVEEDPNVSKGLKYAHFNTVYSVIKYMRGYGQVRKDIKTGKYHMTDKGFAETEPKKPLQVDIAEPLDQNFKLVPLTQREKVRQAVRKLLEKQGSAVHRSDIGEYLVRVGVFEPTMKQPVERATQYMCDWPEFVPDGQGYYTLVPENLENESGHG
jgi:hypothetical protein